MKHRLLTAIVSIALALTALVLSAPSAGAVAPPLLTQVPEDGKPGAGAGRLSSADGIAADPNLPGHVYVVDRNSRVNEFTPWGEFVKAWGWGVIDGEAELQSCTKATGCLEGLMGGGSGQLWASQAVAVDGAGNVYALEFFNHRVQKFDPTGGPGEDEAEFLLMFGLDVNKTKVEEGAPEAQRNLCTAASGDVCQAGIAGTGPGQFGNAGFRNRIAASPLDNTIFVGEDERIQVFEPNGSFKEEIAMPSGNEVSALATDAAGKLYVAFSGEDEVRKLEPHGPTATFLSPGFSPDDPAETPRALALDGNGNLYVAVNDPDGPGGEPQKVQKFDPSGKCLTCGSAGEGGEPGFDRSLEEVGDLGETVSRLESIAASGACEAEDAYVVHITPSPAQSLFKAFGDSPNPDLCPPPLAPPEIKAQYALSAETTSAELRADINPKFWKDTTFQVEYGTAPCAAGGCTNTTTARTLTKQVASSALPTPSVFLEGLAPATTYHYRFVAQSSGGGPVYGVDPDGDGPEEATPEAGLEASFTTYAKPKAEACPVNEAFRTGPSALLPDCRAHEMVSPLDKESGDVIVLPDISNLPARRNQSSEDGERLTYGAASSFAGAQSAPYTTQYIAARHQGEGWVTHPISPLRGKVIDKAVFNTGTSEFKAFSPDLCQGWLMPAASMPQASAGAPVGFLNLFRRSDSECGAQSLEPLNLVAPPNLPGSAPNVTAPSFRIELQGFSSDGSLAVFVANDVLAEGGGSFEGGGQLYVAKGAAERMLCLLPDASPFAKSCWAGGIEGGGPWRAVSRTPNATGAVSADGSRVFWTAGLSGGSLLAGPIYVRENPFQAESARLLGSASGSGDLTGPALITGNLVESTTTVKKAKVTGGAIAVGQEITATPGGNAAGAIPAETTITKIEETGESVFTLTLSKAVTLTKSSAQLSGFASNLVTNATAESGAFAVGQEFAAPGAPIPAGTTIEALEETAPGVFKLTLSAKATQGITGAPLRTTSACSEADKACTLAVSQEAEAEVGSSSSFFLAASENGSKALFRTGGGLYEFRLADHSTHLIAGEIAITSNVSGFVGASKDASRLYLVSKEALGGPNAEGKSALAGQANLYLYEDGGFRFIGATNPSKLTSRVSPDGSHLAFMSSASLTGYDNTDAVSGKADAEVFLYDAGGNEGAGRLVCASCNPSGARPRGVLVDKEGSLVKDEQRASEIPVPDSPLYASRLLSEDGKRLFFESYDALLANDTNGQKDVYEWEAPGSGGCGEESPSFSPLNQGCVDLISSGKSPRESEFIDASPDGRDVFFTTLSSLVPQDYGLVDIYDAREGGGLPSPPGPPSGCEGEACQSPSSAPNDPTPASASFKGAGNPVARPPVRSCRKPKVRRKGRCVTRQAKKRVRHNRRQGR